MPYRTRTDKMLILILFSGVLFWLLPIFIGNDVLQKVINSAVFGIATTVLVTWGSSAYYAIRGNVTAENQHIIATVAVWFIVWVQRLYAMIFLYMDRPMWMQISAFPAFVTYMFGITGIFIIIAPAMIESVDKREYIIQTVVGVGLGTIAAVVSLVIQLLN